MRQFKIKIITCVALCSILLQSVSNRLGGVGGRTESQSNRVTEVFSIIILWIGAFFINYGYDGLKKNLKCPSSYIIH